MGNKKYFLITTLVGIVVGLSYLFGIFAGLENFFSDRLFFKKEIHPDIVIVEIDSESINKIGQWPWPRKVFANFLEKIEKYNPKVVALDIMFSERSRLGTQDDAELSLFLSARRRTVFSIILPVEFISEKILEPLPEFRKNENVKLAHVGIILDKDGVVRKLPAKIQNFEQFGFEVAKIAGAQTLFNSEKIAYASGPKSIRRIPFWRVLEEEKIENLDEKIIFVGVTSLDLHDEFQTPFSKGGKMPGVEIQANIANMFLKRYSLNSIPRSAMFFWIVFSAISLYAGPLHNIPAILFFEKGYLPNLIHLNLAWILSLGAIFLKKYLSQKEEKKKIKDIFGKYVAKDVLEEILKNPAKFNMGGEEKEITVLFSDIRGFTSFAEKVSPQELVNFLNKYFSQMAEAVIKNKGTLDKYIGDAVMAFWGAPIENENQADDALESALSMAEKLKKFPGLKIGIGIHSGKAVVGNIGSEERVQYTAIGDSVNIASRLESLNKEFRTQIIISEETKNKLKKNYKLKNLGPVTVKGKENKINIYSIDATH